MEITNSDKACTHSSINIDFKKNSKRKLMKKEETSTGRRDGNKLVFSKTGINFFFKKLRANLSKLFIYFERFSFHKPSNLKR